MKRVLERKKYNKDLNSAGEPKIDFSIFPRSLSLKGVPGRVAAKNDFSREEIEIKGKHSQKISARIKGKLLWSDESKCKILGVSSLILCEKSNFRNVQ